MIKIEVICQCTPQDLLSLARTNKMFRDLLMVRSAAPLWRAARETIGMPDCPEYLSEPAFASLAFDNYCRVSCPSSINQGAPTLTGY